MNNDWLLEEGLGLFLVRSRGLYYIFTFDILQQGSHFIRCGVEGLGSELQRRGISRQAQWGARGIVYVFLHSRSSIHLTKVQQPPDVAN